MRRAYSVSVLPPPLPTVPPPVDSFGMVQYPDWSFPQDVNNSDMWNCSVNTARSTNQTSVLYVDPENMMHDQRPPKPPRMYQHSYTDQELKPPSYASQQWQTPRQSSCSLPRYISTDNVHNNLQSFNPNAVYGNQRSPSFHDLSMHKHSNVQHTHQPERVGQNLVQMENVKPTESKLMNSMNGVPSPRYINASYSSYANHRPSSCNNTFARLPEEAYRHGTEQNIADDEERSHSKQSSLTSDLGDSITDQPHRDPERYITNEKVNNLLRQQSVVRCGVNSLQRPRTSYRNTNLPETNLQNSVSLVQLPQDSCQPDFNFKRPLTPERFRKSTTPNIRRAVSFQEPLNKISGDGSYPRENNPKSLGHNTLPHKPSPKGSPYSDGSGKEYEVQDIADVLSSGNVSNTSSLPYSPVGQTETLSPYRQNYIQSPGKSSQGSSPFNSSTSTVLDKRDVTDVGSLSSSGGSSKSSNSSKGSTHMSENGSSGAQQHSKGNSPRRMLNFSDQPVPAANKHGEINNENANESVLQDSPKRSSAAQSPNINNVVEVMKSPIRENYSNSPQKTTNGILKNKATAGPQNNEISKSTSPRIEQLTCSPRKPGLTPSNRELSMGQNASFARMESKVNGSAKKLNSSAGSDSFQSSSSGSFASSPGSDSLNGSGSGHNSSNGSGSRVAKSFTHMVNGPLVTILYDFLAMEEDDLTVKRGEVVRLLNDDDRQWLWVAKVKGEEVGKEGFIPTSYALLNDNKDKLVKSMQQVKTYL